MKCSAIDKKKGSKLTEMIIIVVITAVHPAEREATATIAEKESHLSLKVVYILYQIVTLL
jgi:hypothetical protein